MLSGKVTEVVCQGTISSPGFFPTALRFAWPGEKGFAGRISYGVANDIDTRFFKNSAVVVVGHGAFAIENIRTALECGASKVTMLARKRSLVMPRAVGYMINAGLSMSLEEVCDVCEPWYRAIGVDVRKLPSILWTPTGAMMNQRNSPISDLYFVAQQCQLLEQFDELPARVNRNDLALESGRRVEVNIFIKSLGPDQSPRSQLDDVFQLKTLNGFFINGNPALMVFATATTSTGARSFSLTSNTMPMLFAMASYFHFRDFPEDFTDDLRDSLPTLNSLASNRGMLGALGPLGAIPRVAQRFQLITELKVQRMREAYSDEIRASRFAKECEADWNALYN